MVNLYYTILCVRKAKKKSLRYNKIKSLRIKLCIKQVGRTRTKNKKKTKEAAGMLTANKNGGNV